MEKARKSKWTANISLYVCALLYHVQGIHETAANVANVRKSAGSDERTALDQALLLVQLLKSEYGKVVKENDNLKRKNKLDETNVQTCATTTERMSENLNRKFFENMFQHRRRWRPQLAAYNYYGDPIGIGKGNRRSFDYGEEFGTQPNKTHHSSTAASTEKITTVSEPPSPVAKTTAENSKDSKKFNETISTLSTTIFTTIQTSTVNNDIVPTAKSEFNSRSPISNDNEVNSKVVTTKNTVPKKTSLSSVNYTVSNFVTRQSSSSRLAMIKLMMTFSKKESEAKLNSMAPISNDNEVDSKVVTTKNTVRSKTSLSSDNYTNSNFETIQSSTPRPEIIRLIPFSKKVSEVILSTHVTQPELSQAAAELAKELGVAPPGGSAMPPRFPALWRGSTKVYLADSTRYPLPLPENHAFCYTNPHSALCRTLI